MASSAGTALAVQSAPLEQATSAFVSARPRLLGIARRILRSPSEAEDVVQDAWLRWQRVDREAVKNAQAFLATTTTRLALNRAQSARRRRELPFGSWVHEPADPAQGPEPAVERAEAVWSAIHTILAQLTPNERAAFVLREAFDYQYDQIADLLHLRPANCRQLVRRSRSRILSDRHRPVSADAAQRLHAAFLGAARDGQIADLERLLAADAGRQGTAPACHEPRGRAVIGSKRDREAVSEMEGTL